MTARVPSQAGVAPLATKLRQITDSLAGLNLRQQTYVIDQTTGDAVAIVGDVTHAPMSTFSATPSMASTGLTGFGLAVYDGSAWVKLPSGTGILSGNGPPVTTEPAGTLYLDVNSSDGGLYLSTGSGDVWEIIGGYNSHWNLPPQSFPGVLVKKIGTSGMELVVQSATDGAGIVPQVFITSDLTDGTFSSVALQMSDYYVNVTPSAVVMGTALGGSTEVQVWGTAGIAGQGIVLSSQNGITIADDSASGINISANPPGGSGTGVGGVVISGQSGGTSLAASGTSEPLSFFDQASSSHGADQQTVTGSKGGNAALASLLTALAKYGLIIDSST